LAAGALLTAALVGYSPHATGPSLGHAPIGAPPATKILTSADLLLAASTAQGIHLRYAGITTGPLDANHDNDIPIQSFQFGVDRSISSPAGGGTRTASTPSVSEITLTHATDSFSLPLLKAALKGAAPGRTANLYFTDLSGAGGAPFDFLEIDLGQTLLSSFSMSSGGSVPFESFSLNFVTMTFTYRISGTTTVQKLSYNIATGT
jgi:type VI secretion system secreted protein Hcp